MQKEIQDILEEVAKEFNLPTKVIEKVYSNIWNTVRKSISSGIRDNYESHKRIYIPHFGFFGVKKKRFESVHNKLERLRQKKIEKGQNGTFRFERYERYEKKKLESNDKFIPV